MKYHFLSRLLPAVLVLIIFASCAKRVVTTDSSLGAKAVLERALKATPVLCAYKGRIAITINGEDGRFSFSALLDKQCSGDFKLTVLGALNRPLFELASTGGEVSAEAADPEMKKSVLATGREYAGILSMLLRSPLKLPDGAPVLKTGDNEYELTFPAGTKIIASGTDFFITRYIYGNASHSYDWKNGVISAITAGNDNQSLTIRFMNGEGWR